MGLGIILVIIAIAIAIGVAVGLKRGEDTKKLMEEGKVIKRDFSFVETAEIFTLSNADFSDVVSTIKEADLSDAKVSADSSSDKQAIIFMANGWSAQLYRIENDGEKCVYCFNFTNWQTSRALSISGKQSAVIPLCLYHGTISK